MLVKLIMVLAFHPFHLCSCPALPFPQNTALKSPLPSSCNWRYFPQSNKSPYKSPLHTINKGDLFLYATSNIIAIYSAIAPIVMACWITGALASDGHLGWPGPVPLGWGWPFGTLKMKRKKRPWRRVCWAFFLRLAAGWLLAVIAMRWWNLEHNFHDLENVLVNYHLWGDRHWKKIFGLKPHSS